MTRFKLLVLGMLSVFVFGAFSAASASAQPTATCTPNGGTKTLSMVCVQNSAGTLLVLGLPALETIEVLSKKEPGTESSLVEPSNGLEITCTKAENTGLVDGNSAASAKLEEVIVTFTECTAPKPEHCVLNNGTIKTELLTAENTTKEDGDLTFKPGANGIFAEFIVKSSGGTCLAAQEVVVTGEVLGTLLTPEVDEVTHLIDFEKATGLLVNTKPTEFTLTEEVVLDTPASWTGFAANPPWGIFLTETIS